jgi:hypothetical protein
MMQGKGWRSARLLLTAAVAVTATLCTTGVALAATQAAAPVRTTLTQTEMHVVGYNAAIAAANGYEIRTAPGGRQYSVKTGTPTDAAPQDEVGGDCGTSWLYETAQGGLTVYVETGFSVIAPTVDLYWNVTLNDQGGSSTLHYPSRATNGYWVYNRYVGGLTAGKASSVVDPGSWAQLNNGDICYSGSPSAGTTIY